MRYGTITPTDFDVFMDFRNRAFVVAELKYTGTALPRGQRLAIERAVDGWNRGGIPALALIAEHAAAPPDDIDVAICIVREWRFDGSWHEDGRGICLRDAIDGFLRRQGLSDLLGVIKEVAEGEAE